MDHSFGSDSNSYAPLQTSYDNYTASSEGSEATTRSASNSWSFRSNSFPKNSSSSDTGASSARSGPLSWAKNIQSWTSSSKGPQGTGSDAGKPGFNLFNNIGFHKQTSMKNPVSEAPLESTSAPVSPSQENGPFNSLKTGFLNGSRNAAKAIQTKARHMVSQNKRRYQEGGFDLDLSYITENIIAMGFPAGDMSSGFFGYVEGFYRNHMEEVIKFFETQHKGKYKVYNLCSERLYDAALFEGKVACFPFDDHNCPQLQLISAFCASAYSWLKGDLENVVVIHCKAGMARTGLMISCLLLYLKFFPTCEESISYYNQKRCIDGKGLVLPSQLRYVKYFERVLREFDGEITKNRKCILRGIRLHRCPYWIRPAITVSDHNGVLFSSKKHPRTKDMMSEDIWFAAPRRGVMVFALPGERCIADLNGDFKVHFQDRHGDFYCWLNTNMMESRQVLTTSDLDGFDKRRLPSPGFQVEIVVLDHDSPWPTRSTVQHPPSNLPGDVQGTIEASKTNAPGSLMSNHPTHTADQIEAIDKEDDKDSVFSEADGDTPMENRGLEDASRQREAGEGYVVHGGIDGEALGGADPSGTVLISGNIDDVLNRMRISQVGRTGRPNSPPFALDDSSIPRDMPESVARDGMKVGVAAGAPAGSPLDEQLESSSSVPGVGEVGAIGNTSQHSTWESGHQDFAGKGVNSLDPKFIERDGRGSFRGDLQEERSQREALTFVAPVVSSDFQAIALASAADASVFTFGEDEDYESE